MSEILYTILGAAIFWLGMYLKDYLKAKAINSATKEDIREITREIEIAKTEFTKQNEEIKLEFIKQNEELKAQLALSNQHVINIKTAERDAIIEFNKKISVWLYSLIRFNLETFDLNNFSGLKLSQSNFSRIQYECDIAESHLAIFVSGNTFVEYKNELVLSIQKIEEILLKTMDELHWIYVTTSLELTGSSNINLQRKIPRKLIDEIDQRLEKYKAESAPHSVRAKQIHAHFLKIMNERLTEIGRN